MDNEENIENVENSEDIDKENNAKKRKKKHSRLITNVAICVCVAVMLVSGGYLLKNFLEDKKGVDTYSSLEQYLATPPQSVAPAVSQMPDVSSVPDAPETPEQSQVEITIPEEAETAEPEAAYDPGDDESDYTPGPAPDYWPVVDFDGLRALNDDVVAWIIGPGTNINYPVVQGADNDYYLNHLFTGANSKAGAIFMDYRNKPDFTQRNTVIYGHHMRNRTMFWTLTLYRTQPYYNNHPAIRIVTLNGSYEIQVIASYVATVEDNAWKVGFEDSDAFLAWVEEAKSKSDIASDVEVTEGDRVVTLSTCTYEFSNARYIVMGKLVAV